MALSTQHMWWLLTKDLIATSLLSIFLLSHVSVMHTMLKFPFLEILQMKLCLYCFSVIKPLPLPTMMSTTCSVSGYLSAIWVFIWHCNSDNCHSMAIDDWQKWLYGDLTVDLLNVSGRAFFHLLDFASL